MPTNNPYNPQPHPETQLGAAQSFPIPISMPSSQMQRPAPRTWRERMMRRFGMDTAVSSRRGELTMPEWMQGKVILFFLLSMVACWIVYGHVPETELWIVAVLSIILFVYGGSVMLINWRRAGEKQFLRNVFIASFAIRLLWVLYCYFFFNPEHYGTTYGSTADVDWYIPFAHDLASWFVGDASDTLSMIIESHGAAIDDTGYPIWLGFLYMLFGEDNEIFIPLLTKCLLSSYCAISIYHVAKRHYGEGVARLSAVFLCVNPNMVYWCSTMMKESEMVFLVCLSVDNFDRALSSDRQYTFRALLPGILATLALMFFRSVLGIVIFLAVFAHIVMASRRIMSTGKKIIAGLLVGSVIMMSMGDRIRTQSRMLIEKAQSDSQQKNMEWRANRDYEQGGKQTFARYAGAAVFAPLIFTIPFPTFTAAHTGQLTQMQLSGGYFIKNVLSFFVIIVMILMLISGEWRRHVFILAYTIGYLMVLVMSPFAQSGRFHMPIWPMLMLFAAYGVQMAKGNVRLQRWFPLVLVLEVVVCLAWNWFKLKGRGMI